MSEAIKPEANRQLPIGGEVFLDHVAHTGEAAVEGRDIMDGLQDLGHGVCRTGSQSDDRHGRQIGQVITIPGS